MCLGRTAHTKSPIVAGGKFWAIHDAKEVQRTPPLHSLLVFSLFYPWGARWEVAAGDHLAIEWPSRPRYTSVREHSQVGE